MSYADLQVTTHFSFLRGASSADELFAAAASLGTKALGIVDRNSLAGVVRAHVAAKATGVRLIVGCRLDLQCGTSLLVYPTDRDAYSRLCRLLTIGKTRGGKGQCLIDWPDVEEWQGGLLAILLPDELILDLASELARLNKVFGGRAYCALSRRFLPDEAKRFRTIADAAAKARVPLVATNDVLYHCPSRRMLQDVVTCIRLHTTIDNAGFKLERHADRYLKAPQEMERLFRGYEQAVHRTWEIAERCRFSLDQLTYTYPTETLEDGLTAQERLEKLTWEGAERRYSDGLPDNVAMQLRHELNLIERMDYAPYFLTVESIVRFARSKGILCQGRGSAANSAVCYALGVTAIDPVRQGLLFERFVSEERREPPDIDVDFEHERREEVIQWIYETYGRTRSALTAVVSRYRARGAVREVGKALGFDNETLGRLSGLVHTWEWKDPKDTTARQFKDAGLDLRDRRIRKFFQLYSAVQDLPRHLGQHSGGMVICQGQLDSVVPLEPAAMPGRVVVQWDKEDCADLGIIKVDLLGLGMMAVLEETIQIIRDDYQEEVDLAHLPQDDPAVYAALQQADCLLPPPSQRHVSSARLVSNQVPSGHAAPPLRLRSAAPALCLRRRAPGLRPAVGQEQDQVRNAVHQRRDGGGRAVPHVRAGKAHGLQAHHRLDADYDRSPKAPRRRDWRLPGRHCRQQGAQANHGRVCERAGQGCGARTRLCQARRLQPAPRLEGLRNGRRRGGARKAAGTDGEEVLRRDRS